MTRHEALLEAAGVAPVGAVTVTGRGPIWATPFAVGEAAASALAAGGAAVAALHAARGGKAQEVAVEVPGAAASLLSFALQTIDGAPTPRPAEQYATVGFYPARDGRTIHLHGGFPNLRDGTLALLGCADDADAIASAVATWDAFELEDALAGAGMCGAVARSAEEWQAHPQGRFVRSQPVVEIERIGDAPPECPPAGARPLAGVRVLDLTRVLAGPTCARTLAAHGASVLKITGPSLPFIEPFVIDTGHGKRSAQLDLRSDAGHEALAALVAEADVFSQGFRSGAFERLGFGEAELAAKRPGIIAVSMNCYGHGGPWQARPGWEQLAQTASGLAVEQGGAASPALVPAAACDYTTGYLAAFGVAVALLRRAQEGGSWAVRASLAQTAQWFQDGPRLDRGAATGPGDLGAVFVESETPQGRLRHLGPVVRMSETPACWEQPTVPLGHDPAQWW